MPNFTQVTVTFDDLSVRVTIEITRDGEIELKLDGVDCRLDGYAPGRYLLEHIPTNVD